MRKAVSVGAGQALGTDSKWSDRRESQKSCSLQCLPFLQCCVKYLTWAGPTPWMCDLGGHMGSISSAVTVSKFLLACVSEVWWDNGGGMKRGGPGGVHTHGLSPICILHPWGFVARGPGGLTTSGCSAERLRAPEATLSIPTRTCFESRKKAMEF